MNILSEPLVNYVILWENRAALVYMLFISLLHIIQNNLFNFIKYKLISKCIYIFCLICLFFSWMKYYFPLYI